SNLWLSNQCGRGPDGALIVMHDAREHREAIRLGEDLPYQTDDGTDAADEVSHQSEQAVVQRDVDIPVDHVDHTRNIQAATDAAPLSRQDDDGSHQVERKHAQNQERVGKKDKWDADHAAATISSQRDAQAEHKQNTDDGPKDKAVDKPDDEEVDSSADVLE